MSSWKATFIAAVLACFGLVSAASAQVVLDSQDFDNPPYPVFHYAYAYSSSGYTPPSSVSVSGNGNPGNAMTAHADFSMLPAGTFYDGFGAGVGNGQPLILPSGDPSQYVVNADLKAANLVAGKTMTPIDIQVNFSVPSGTFAPNNTSFATADISVPVGTTYQTFSNALSKASWSYNSSVPNSSGDNTSDLFTQYYQNVNGIAWNFNAPNSLSDFGNTSDAQFAVDNISFVYNPPTPEPASATVAVVGLCGLLLRRRRA